MRWLDGWMASPTQWTWVWANSGRMWRTGKPGVLQFMGSQRVGLSNWTTSATDTLSWAPRSWGGSIPHSFLSLLFSLIFSKTMIMQTSKMNDSLYFSAFQVTLKTCVTIQFKTTNTLSEVLWNYQWSKNSDCFWVWIIFILKSTSLFLTLKVLKYTRISIVWNQTKGC